jgi:hypothetical protein
VTGALAERVGVCRIATALQGFCIVFLGIQLDHFLDGIETQLVGKFTAVEAGCETESVWALLFRAGPREYSWQP